MTPDQLLGPERLGHIVEARMTIWKHLRDQGWSAAAIAQAFRRTETTVVRALKKK